MESIFTYLVITMALIGGFVAGAENKKRKHKIFFDVEAAYRIVNIFYFIALCGYILLGEVDNIPDDIKTLSIVAVCYMIVLVIQQLPFKWLKNKKK